MPFEDEPRDGDFAAYVDRLVNRPTQASADASQRRRADGDGDGVSDRSTRQSPAVEVIRRDHNSHTEFEYVPVASERPATRESLGAGGAPPGGSPPDGSPRLLGLVQIVLGTGTLVLLINAIERARYSDEFFTLANLVPIGLLTFIASMFLLRGRAKLHEAQARKAARNAAKRQSDTHASRRQRRTGRH